MTLKKQNNQYQPDSVLHPGFTLLEVINNIGMTQTELAQRAARPDTAISEIINGTKSITPETAIQLERVLNISASFWNNLEKNYQQHKARIESQVALEKEISAAKEFPYSEIAKLGWVEKTSNTKERTENLLRFLGVNSFSTLVNVMPLAFRQHTGRNISKPAIQAWLRKGDIDALSIEVKSFNKDGLLQTLPEIKKNSVLQPNEFSKNLVKIFSEYGVALVFTPYLSKSYVCGAAKWIDKNKAMIQLSLRGGFGDIMWFSLFHEVGHLILHSKKERFVDLENNAKSEIEKEADEFAANYLISKNDLNNFLSNHPLDVISIKQFAQSLNIHPGIVIGRLQHEEILNHSQLNSLRIMYKFE